MASIQTVSIGVSTYSVYALTADPVADLVAYFNARLGAASAAVTAATSDDKKRSLVMAADFIDRVTSFSGDETIAGQARSFPRDGAYCNDTAITDGTTPDSLARAEFEVAGLLLQDASLYDGEGTGSNVKAVGAGTASVEFFMPTIGSTRDKRLPQVAYDMLKCLFAGASTTFDTFTSGTDCENYFHPGDFGRDKGFDR